MITETAVPPKSEDFDIIGFLLTGDKTREDFWHSPEFYVDELKRGVCPYKLLNELIAIGMVEKVTPPKAKKGDETKMKWRLTAQARQDQIQKDVDAIAHQTDPKKAELPVIAQPKVVTEEVPKPVVVIPAETPQPLPVEVTTPVVAEIPKPVEFPLPPSEPTPIKVDPVVTPPPTVTHSERINIASEIAQAEEVDPKAIVREELGVAEKEMGELNIALSKAGMFGKGKIKDQIKAMQLKIDGLKKQL